MIPVVSDKYKYVFFYNPKSACSVARKLFLDLHRDELDSTQLTLLDDLKEKNQDQWHSLNQLFPYVEGRNYDDYFKFTLVRHPAMRAVSAYLNRVVLKQTDQPKIAERLSHYCGVNGRDIEINFSFHQFMVYLCNTPFEQIDNAHFAPQSHLKGPLAGANIETPFHPSKAKGLIAFLKRRIGRSDSAHIKLDDVCKVETLNDDFLRVYGVIFKDQPKKLRDVEEALSVLPIHNATFSSSDVLHGAEDESADVLRARGQMPAYQSFMTEQTLGAMAEVFKEDFLLFGYSVCPGQDTHDFEKSKHERIRTYVPEDFDWRHYIDANPDLPVSGINNKADAINHWIHHGRFEGREYCSR